MEVTARLLSRFEAAERLRISVRTLDKLRKDGKIREVRPTPGRVFLTDAAIEECLRLSTNGGQNG